MSLTERERRELSDLASSAADGRITASDQVRLEEILRASADARAYFIRFMDVSAGLAWAARDQQESAQVAGSIQRAHRRGWRTAIAAAAALAFAIFGTWALSRPTAQAADPAVGIATLSTAMNVEWADAQEPGHVGNMLKPGWIRIKSGLAQIDFLNGASVWLEGPVEMRLDSSHEAYCTSGKLVAQVPRGTSDFRLGSPRITVDDKGTGFGMEVNKDKNDALHVFRGTADVMLVQKNSRTQVGAGQALVVDPSGTCTMTMADPNAFSREEFSGRWEMSRPFGGPGIYGPPWMYTWAGGPNMDWNRAPMGPPPVFNAGQWKGADPMDPVRDLLGSTDQRWAVIKQPLQDYLTEQWKSWGMDMNPDEDSVSRAKWNLQFALEDKTSGDQDIAKRLAALRTARADSRKKLQTKEMALRAVLTDDEQAKLVNQGYIP